MDKIDIKEWLQYHCLAKATYLEDLRAAGYIDIKTLKNFPKITEDILDSLNITLAGDRKRFRAIGEQNNLVPDYFPICNFSDSNHVATFMFQLITIFFASMMTFLRCVKSFFVNNQKSLNNSVMLV